MHFLVHRSARSASLKNECCNNGMYHSSMYKECRYVKQGGLDADAERECESSFKECCDAFLETKHCTKGIMQALNTSFCPYMAWDPIPSIRDRIARSCCESCLKGVNDQENGRARGQSNACTKRSSDFNSSIDFNVYTDCCHKRLVKSAALAWHESEDSEAEAVVDSMIQAYPRRNLPQTQDPANSDKPCSQLNTCAHYCIDATPFIPKHCACKTGYFLAEDGGS